VIVNHEKETARDRNGTPDVAALWESPEEAIREARDVVLQLSRTVNTRRIHLPNNPTYRKFLDELNAKLTTTATRATASPSASTRTASAS